MEKTKTINLNDVQAISKNLYGLLEKKVSKISKKSTLQQLKENDIQELKNHNIIFGVYSCKNELNDDAFLVYKIFIQSDLMIKGSYKCWNIIANALLTKNKDKEVASKINIYNQQDNAKLLNTFMQFIKSKTNEDIKPGEYILAGLKLGDLLEIEEI